MASAVANGDIIPSRFVKLDTTSGKTGYVIQAGAGDLVYGIAQQGTRNANFPGLQDYLAAKAGENLRVYSGDHPEDQPYLEVDAAYSQGTLLKSGTLGIGTTANTDGDIYGARMLEQSTLANQIVKVRWEFGYKGA